MSTQLRHRITDAPVDIVDELSLPDGDHALQNAGDDLIHVFAGAAAPDDRAEGRLVLPGRDCYVTTDGAPIWIWSRKGRPSWVVVD